MTTTHEDRAGASRDCRSAQIKVRLAKSLEMAQMKMPCMASDRTGTSITARNPTPSTSSASSSKTLTAAYEKRRQKQDAAEEAKDQHEP